MLLRLAVIFTWMVLSSGFRHFQDRIPNGDQVPHPCKPNFVWRGVGHRNALGGGARNPFGLDFKQQGETWTKELCEADSDGDGRTNGEELGDPNCTWKPDTFPERTTGITHPGVCDPFGDTSCKEKNVGISCETGEFKCPAIHESHVRNITFRFPRTKVPAEETSYMCMTFELKFPEDDPPGQEYHLIASEPVIDNPNVMHHIVLTGCADTAKKLETPTLCYMSQEGCLNPLGLWTLGLPGECMYKDAGYKIGGHGTRTVMMQFHWTNPERRTDYWDESGMIIYYTTQLRRYNAGFFQTGQLNLEIPPGQSRVTQTSTCSSECTKHIINTGVFITTGLNHMHYLGYQQNVELYRDGKKIRDLTKDDVYSYDNPVVHEFNPPQSLLPGDRLETTCVYRSLSKTRTTYFGEGTYDEMCFGIFTVFPVENITFPMCITWGNVEQCGINNGITDGCNLGEFYNKSHPSTQTVRQLVMDNCNFYGSCRQECPAALAKAREHPCLQGEIGDYTLWSLTFTKELDDTKFLAALSSCDCSVDGTAKAIVAGLEASSSRISLPCIFTSVVSLLTAITARFYI